MPMFYEDMPTDGIAMPVHEWTDVNEEQARDIVVAGGSILVRGIAGTGKSHFIREALVPALYFPAVDGLFAIVRFDHQAKVAVRDIWARKDAGSASRAKGLTLSVPPRDSRFMLLTPAS